MHNKDVIDYWRDPEGHLREFNPSTNALDQTIYNFIVPTKRRKLYMTSQELGSEADFEEVDEENSDSDCDRFGGIKKQPDAQVLIDRWKGVMNSGVYAG